MLRHDAIGPLLEAGDPALAWAVGRDVLDERLSPESLWGLDAVLRAERAQRRDGSWAYHGGRSHVRSHEDYAQLATYERLLRLVSIDRLDRRHPMIDKAANFALRFQTAAGDLRGIYGSQFTPNYTADILRLLVEAGFDGDARVERGFAWLLDCRQDDGGWAIPMRTRGVPYSEGMRLREPLETDPAKPSSHLVTGIVLRAFASHPRLRRSAATAAAARLLAGRVFQPDRYPDRDGAEYWTKLAFPFRWTDIVSALDAIANAGLRADVPGVAKGLRWVMAHQHADGLWRSGYRHNPDPLADHWVTLATLRMVKRYLGRTAVLAPSQAGRRFAAQNRDAAESLRPVALRRASA